MVQKGSKRFRGSGEKVQKGSRKRCKKVQVHRNRFKQVQNRFFRFRCTGSPVWSATMYDRMSV